MKKNPACPITKIISGGQTGADIAGLAAAHAMGIPTGGSVTKGARNETGVISPESMHLYGLKELSSESYAMRTAVNVHDSDGTVVYGKITSAGSRLTLRECRLQSKSYLTNPTSATLAQWVQDRNIRILNVAGNRESVNPGMFQHVFEQIIKAFGEPTWV